jgi:hypothetical protein
LSNYKQLWTTADGKEFEVTQCYMDDDGATWVDYRNLQTNETYNCLRDAFVARFTVRQV